MFIPNIANNTNVQLKNEVMKTRMKNLEFKGKSEIEHRIEAIAWGLFFVWVGVAFLANVSDGVGLLGVGIITLGAQAVRSYYKLNLEGFWLVVGTCFVVGGLWEFINPGIALVPVLLIIAGVALLYSVWSRSKSKS